MSESVQTHEPVLVLGAGLMGRLLALALADAGHAVRLVDAGPADGSGAAAHVAAAMLAPLAESAITEPSVVAMGQYALTRWPQLLAGLVRPVYFQRNGTMVVWHRQDAHEAQRFSGLLAQTGRALPTLPRPRQSSTQPPWSAWMSCACSSVSAVSHSMLTPRAASESISAASSWRLSSWPSSGK